MYFTKRIQDLCIVIKASNFLKGIKIETNHLSHYNHDAYKCFFSQKTPLH